MQQHQTLGRRETHPPTHLSKSIYGVNLAALLVNAEVEEPSFSTDGAATTAAIAEASVLVPYPQQCSTTGRLQLRAQSCSGLPEA